MEALEQRLRGLSNQQPETVGARTTVASPHVAELFGFAIPATYILKAEGKTAR
jgi:hypothetical protein